MKKRLWFLPLYAALALSACGDNSILGTYKFQMGKNDGTKMGAYITLTDEEVHDSDDEKTLLGKKFTLEIQANGIIDGLSTSSSSSSSSSSETSSSEEEDDSSKGTSFYGYYNQGGTDLDGSEFPSDHISLGTTMIGDELGISFNIPSSFIELLIYAELDSKTLNIYIPVSITDLEYQLYWYGYRVDIENFSLPEKLDYVYYTGKQPTIGSHPTEADIALIREHEATIEDSSFASFRDYHTLTMGLVK